MVFIVDIDGTVALIGHRLSYIQQDPPDWAGFYKACVHDEPIDDVIHLLRILAAPPSNAMIVMFTGRSEEIRRETTDWLNNKKVPSHRLYMRPEKDYRQDYVIKREMLNRFIDDYTKSTGHEPDIRGVFEDRQQCVDMYRAKGLRVYQVADGKF